MNNKYLSGKKVLFISWAFYQYPQLIAENMKEHGAEVHYFSTSPTNSLIKAKIFKKFKFFNKCYFKSILKKIENEKYDYIFIINAATFPEYFLENISNKFKETKKILYCWDSISTFSFVENYFKYFDKIYTFDSDDAKKNKDLIFLPLFYYDDLYCKKVPSIKYDFSFIGLAHTKRYKFINSVKSYADKNSYTYYFNLYLPSLAHYFVGKYVKKNFSNATMKEFIFKSVSQDKIKEITNQSKIVIDLELSNQTGLTMRTIESLGMRKKLITTNKNIVDYDFYNTNNILIVDRESPVIPNEFMETEYVTLPEEIYNKYSLTNWLYTIFK